MTSKPEFDNFTRSLTEEQESIFGQVSEKTGFSVDYLKRWAYSTYESYKTETDEKVRMEKTISSFVAGTKNIYKSADDIPVHRNDIAPIDVRSLGIPECNFIIQFYNFVSSITDTYPEYIIQSALSALATVVQRRIFVSMNGRRFYPNLWQGNGGASGYARKSAAISEAKKVVKNSCGDLYLSSDLNPASMIDSLATEIKNKKRDKEGNISWEPELLMTCDEGHNIIRSRRTYIKDEFGQLLRELQKPTHSQFKETFLLLHSCETYTKELVGKYVIIEDPYLAMYWSTTADTIKKLLTKSDIASGWLARTLYVEPSYEKIRMDATDSDDEDADILYWRKELEGMLAKINLTLKNTVMFDRFTSDGENKPEEKPLRVQFYAGTLQMLNDWVGEREAYYAKIHDELLGAYVARFQENVVRIAMLIELGNLPELIKGESESRITEFKISRASMESAFKLVDMMYMPYAIKLSTELREDNAGTAQTGVSNAILRVEHQLSSNLKIDMRTCQRNCSMNKNTFDECVASLESIGAVEKVRVRTKENKLQDWLVYYPPELRFEPFCNSYVDAEVSEYVPGFKVESFTPLKNEVSKIIDELLSENDIS
jgi:Protein of unknown function (DUF3987)